jgi:F420-dependent oxidoreductase-like protein
MDIGVHYANFSHPGGAEALAPRLAETARVADQGGAEWFTVMDHYFQMEVLGGPPEPMLEGYTTLGYLAALTERVRLSLLVTGVTCRYPGLLAKIVATLDVLCGGRSMLGLGAAWYEREQVGLGVPFPTVKERFERLEETLQICRQMWSTDVEDQGRYDGRHYQLAETVCVPPPLQPRLPILIGGGGELKTLRLVATYADACNVFGESPEVVANKLDVLRRHCDDVGRDYESIRRTMIGMGDPVADPDGFLKSMEQYAAVGIGLVTLMPQGDDPVAWTTRLCEDVLPRMKEL